MDFSPHAQVRTESPILRRVIVTLAIAIFDIAFNAVAGRFAALTGAKINSWSRSSITAHIVYDRSEVASIGTRAGLFKAGLLAAWNISQGYGAMNLPVSLLFTMVSSRFGIAVLVACLVSTMVFGTVNEIFIKPALIASLFLGSEMTAADENTELSLTAAFWDSLSGYIFARMIRREGFEICSNKAGFLAGMVYGLFTTLKTFLIAVARGPTSSTSVSSRTGTITTARNNLRTYKVVDPGMCTEGQTYTTSSSFLGWTSSSSSSSSHSTRGFSSLDYWPEFDNDII